MLGSEKMVVVVMMIMMMMVVMMMMMIWVTGSTAEGEKWITLTMLTPREERGEEGMLMIILIW